jgi:hypothetical protein
VVVDPESGRIAQLLMAGSVCGHVWGWTADGRFAIFGERHPKGNATTYVFDARQWAWILETPECALQSTGSYIGWEPCGEYPAALSPGAPRFLMENGRLINLPNAQPLDLLPDLRDRKPRIQMGWGGGYLASWSPDDKYLAFVIVIDVQPGYAKYEHWLYLALGDGTQVRQVALLEGFPWYLRWREYGRSLSLATGDSDGVVDQSYIVDALSGQVQIIRATPTPLPLAVSPERSVAPKLTLIPFLTTAPEAQVTPPAPTPPA